MQNITCHRCSDFDIFILWLYCIVLITCCYFLLRPHEVLKLWGYTQVYLYTPYRRLTRGGGHGPWILGGNNVRQWTSMQTKLEKMWPIQGGIWMGLAERLGTQTEICDLPCHYLFLKLTIECAGYLVRARGQQKVSESA